MEAIERVQESLRQSRLDGWLIWDFRAANPVFSEFLGCRLETSRRAFVWLPALGDLQVLAHQVDEGPLARLGLRLQLYASRQELEDALRRLLEGAERVAMEYSPQGRLPALSRVDAGTVELVRGLGPEVVSSADLVQLALGRWSEEEQRAHVRAARKLGRIVEEAFAFIAHRRPTEHGVVQFIRRRLGEEGLVTDGGPIVAANQHSSLPHFEADPSDGRAIGPGDWVLIDLWAQEGDSPYADVTWVGYVGDRPPTRFQEAFQLVSQARDLAIEFLAQSYQEGLKIPGCVVDQVARDYLSASGYGQYFTHRLGHSLGHSVHGLSANLDSYETLDERELIAGIGFTVEPGLYLPDFGVRTEVDVFMSQDGPQVTTPVQRDIVLIGK